RDARALDALSAGAIGRRRSATRHHLALAIRRAGLRRRAVGAGLRAGHADVALLAVRVAKAGLARGDEVEPVLRGVAFFEVVPGAAVLVRHARARGARA